MEASTKARIYDVKKILTVALLSRMEDVDEVVIAGGPKREVGVWLMLLIVIAGWGSTKDAIFIISLTIGIRLVSGSIIGACMEKIIRSKILWVLTKTRVGQARNADKIVANRGLLKEVDIRVQDFQDFLQKSELISQLI